MEQIECSETSEFNMLPSVTGARGGVMLKALRYKPTDHGFDSRWFHWIFLVI